MKGATKGESVILWISLAAIILCVAGFVFGMIKANGQEISEACAGVAINSAILGINLKNIKDRIVRDNKDKN